MNEDSQKIKQLEMVIKDLERKKKKQRSFGTILKSQSEKVKAGASLYDSKKIKPMNPNIVIPKEWNFYYNWSFYLSRIRNQKTCGNCWAQSVVTCLEDRLGIMTSGQVKATLSPYQVTVCEGVINSEIKPDPSNELALNLSAHTNTACEGNTIYNALKYMYKYGSLSEYCFDKNLAEIKGLTKEGDIEGPSNLPYCSQIIGKKYNTCIDGNTPAKFFRTIMSYNIPNDVTRIKYEILRLGPVVSAMIMYVNFINWDGIGIYTGPNQGDSVEGGHAMKIMGWGVENGIEYWWVANSWGTEWGYLGYCKIKIGIRECEFEDNVVAFVPDIPYYKIEYNDYEPIETNQDRKEREMFGVDSETGLKYSSINDFYKANGLQIPLLFNKDTLPDYSKFNAYETVEYRNPPPLFYVNVGENVPDKSSISNIVLMLIFIIVYFVVLYFILSKIFS